MGEQDWDQADAHIWTVHTGDSHKANFVFTWFYDQRRLAIDYGTHRFGPYIIGAARDVLESLEDLLGDDGAGMASYAEFSDGSTEIYRGRLKDGREYLSHIQLHAYMEIQDSRLEPVRFTLDQMADFHDALKEVLFLIEEGYEGNEPWCLNKEVDE